MEKNGESMENFHTKKDSRQPLSHRQPAIFSEPPTNPGDLPEKNMTGEKLRSMVAGKSSHPIQMIPIHVYVCISCIYICYIDDFPIFSSQLWIDPQPPAAGGCSGQSFPKTSSWERLHEVTSFSQHGEPQEMNFEKYDM